MCAAFLFAGTDGQFARQFSAILSENHDPLVQAGILPVKRDTFVATYRDLGHEANLINALSGGTTPRDLVLDNRHFFASPSSIFSQHGLFPNCEKRMTDFAAATSGSTVYIILCIENLPEFFLRTKNSKLEEKIASTDWSTLIDLSWLDVVRNISSKVSHGGVLVIPGEFSAMSLPLLFSVFSDHIELSQVRGVFALARRLYGAAAAKRTSEIIMDGPGTHDDMMSELGRLWQNVHQPSSTASFTLRFGHDKSTVDLLTQRYIDDIHLIEKVPGVTFFGDVDAISEAYHV